MERKLVKYSKSWGCLSRYQSDATITMLHWGDGVV